MEEKVCVEVGRGGGLFSWNNKTKEIKRKFGRKKYKVKILLGIRYMKNLEIIGL